MTLDLETLRSYCMKKRDQVSEEFPFGETTFVFKTNGKIFALISSDTHPLSMDLKCDPEHAVELREQYPAVAPGYHMNKKHWNTVTLDGTIPSGEICAMIDHSYEMVRESGKSKTVRRKISLRTRQKPGR